MGEATNPRSKGLTAKKKRLDEVRTAIDIGSDREVYAVENKSQG